MRTRRNSSDPQPLWPAAENDERGIPACSTSPFGRLRFVLGELRDIWHEYRHGRE